MSASPTALSLEEATGPLDGQLGHLRLSVARLAFSRLATWGEHLFTTRLWTPLDASADPPYGHDVQGALLSRQLKGRTNRIVVKGPHDDSAQA